MFELLVPADRANAVADAVEAIFGQRPALRPEQRDGGTRDPLAVLGAVTGIVALLLQIPQSLVAARDLIERKRAVDAARALISAVPAGTLLRVGDRTLMLAPGSEAAALDLIGTAPSPPSQPRHDLYLSTAPADLPTACALATALRARGLRAYLPADDLRAGDHRHNARWQAQRAARATVVILPRGPLDDLQRGDIAAARDHATPGPHRLIPACLQPPPALPPGLEDLIAVDLTDPDRAAARIAEALNSEPPR